MYVLLNPAKIQRFLKIQKANEMAKWQTVSKRPTGNHGRRSAIGAHKQTSSWRVGAPSSRAYKKLFKSPSLFLLFVVISLNSGVQLYYLSYQGT